MTVSRRGAVVGLALLGPALVPGHAVAGRHHRTPCQRLVGKDLAPGRALKVVHREYDDGSTNVFACLLPRGRVRRIASFSPESDFESGGVDVLATGSRHVLFSLYSAERGSGRGLWRADVGSGRRRVLAGYTCDPFGACTGDEVLDAVMHRSGVVAATLRGSTCCTGSGPTVSPPRLVRFPLDAAPQVLDRGDGIANLAATDAGFSWTRDGVPASAPAAER